MKVVQLGLRTLIRIDVLAFVAMAVMAGVGIVFIYSAGRHSPSQADLYSKQFGWALVGLGIFVAAVVTDYRRIGAQALWLYLITLAVLVMTLAFGVTINGGRRWLRLFGVLLQPSEFAKIATVLMVARHFSRPDLNLARWSILLHAAVIAGLPFLLIAAEPDLGSAAVLAPVVWVMLLIAGVPAKRLLMLVLLAALMAPVGWLAMDEYQKERVRVFLDPGRDPKGTGWNKIQSEMAVGSGGLRGKGYLAGTQKSLGYLPQTVAPTDFIYSVIGEEAGFMGSAALLGLFAVVIGGGFRAAAGARDKFGQLLAAGLSTLVFCHVFVNTAMTIGLLPITGIPLPLLSYGGSIMVSTMLGLGLIQGVYARRHAG